jgi:hypothetical protein
MFNRGEPPWPVRREVFRRGIAEYGNFRIALETSLARADAETRPAAVHRAAQHVVPHGDAREAAPGSTGSWSSRREREVSPRVRGRALAVRAEIAFDLQDYGTLERCATESLELAGPAGDDFPVPTALRVISQARGRAGHRRGRGTTSSGGIAAAEATG